LGDGSVPWHALCPSRGNTPIGKYLIQPPVFSYRAVGKKRGEGKAFGLVRSGFFHARPSEHWSPPATRHCFGLLNTSPFSGRTATRDNNFLPESIVAFGTWRDVALLDIDGGKTVTVLGGAAPTRRRLLWILERAGSAWVRSLCSCSTVVF
jgi:hypothetical protein